MDRIAIVSDLHICSTLGLCPPKINLDEGGTYIYSPLQKIIWTYWLDFWQHFYSLDGTKLFIKCDGNHNHSSACCTEYSYEDALVELRTPEWQEEDII